MRKSLNIEISLLIFIMGVPFSNILKELTNGLTGNLSDVLMVISALLLLIGGRRNLLKQRREYFIFICYQLYVLLYGVVSAVGFMQGNYGLVYTVFCIVSAYGLGINQKQIDCERFVKMCWFIASVLCVAVLYLSTNHFTKFFDVHFTYLPFGTDRLTLSRVVIIYVACFFAFKSDKLFEKILKWVFMVIAIYDIMLLNRRSFLILTAMMLALYVVRLFSHGFRLKQRYILSIMAVAVLVFFAYIVIRNNQELLRDLNRFLDSVSNALSTFMGEEDTDVSAAFRVMKREQYLNEFFNEFTTWEVLFGKGYMHEWIDLPVFQIVIDMGVIGGIIYWCLHGYLYYCLYFKLWKEDGKLLELARYYAIIPLTAQFRGGFPYGYTVYLPFLFITYTILLTQDAKRGMETPSPLLSDRKGMTVNESQK